MLGTATLVEGPAAGSDSVLLTLTPATGGWTATATDSWLHVNASSGTGSATVVFTFDANPGATRTGSLTIAGQMLVITQASISYVAANPLTTLVPDLYFSTGVALDGSGNVYTADTENNTIKKWSAATRMVSTLVSSGLNSPYGVAADASGNVYIADTENSAIKVWTAATQAVSTLVSSGLNKPCGVALDGSGNVYIADTRNSAIKVWTAATQNLTTLVSSGLDSPKGLALDGSGNVYIADTNNNAIKKWTMATQTVSTLVSSGLNSPYGVAADASGNVYIADTGNSAIKVWTSATGTLSTLVSSGLSYPEGMAVDGSGNVYIADTENTAIKVWTAATQTVSTLISPAVANPEGIAVDGSGNVYIADTGNSAIKVWTAATQNLTTLVSSGLNKPCGVALDGAGNVYIADTGNSAIKVWTAATQNLTTLVSSGLGSPKGLALDGSGNVYIADAGDKTLKVWTAATQTLSTLVSSSLSNPLGVAVDRSDNVYISDEGTDSVKVWNAVSQTLSTLFSGLHGPQGVAVDGSGNVYVADFDDRSIKKWTAAAQTLSAQTAVTHAGAVQTKSSETVIVVSGPRNTPIGLAVDGSGNLYIAADGPNAIESIPRAFVATTTKIESSAAGSDSLPGVLPASMNLLQPFAPASDQPWLTMGGISNGVVNFDFTANTGADRTAHITLLGKQVTVNQGGQPPTVAANTASLAGASGSMMISGTAFNPVAGNNLVTFNNRAVGKVTAATPTALTVTFITRPVYSGPLTAVVTTDGKSSGSPVQVARVILSADLPTVTITSPTAAAKVNESIPTGLIAVTGTAAARFGMTGVEVSLNGGVFAQASTTMATGGKTATYTATINPVPGGNSVTVRSTDTWGNLSSLVTHSFTYVVLRPLTLATTLTAVGIVAVAPALVTGKAQVGVDYTVTTTPKTGYLMDFWDAPGVTGTVVAGNKLTFVMTAGDAGATITAHLLLNPFLAVAGSYNGLILPQAGFPTAVSTTGFFSATVAGATGALTGKLTIDGIAATLTGNFDPHTGLATIGGVASNFVYALALDLTDPASGGTGKIAGSVTQNNAGVLQSVSLIDADRAAFSAVHHAPASVLRVGDATRSGVFTLALPARATQTGFTAAQYPQGSGIGTVTVTTAGVASFIGTLADGTEMTASAPLSKDLQWPLFALISNRLGLLAGQVTFAAVTDSDLTAPGTVWIKPYTQTQYYPWGWDSGIVVDVIGAHYTAPTMAAVLPGLGATSTTGNATLTFGQGQLSAPLANSVNISTASKVTAAGTPDTSFSATLNPATGLMSGSFSYSASPLVTTKFNGVILQKGANKGGYGFFLTPAPVNLDGNGESGKVSLFGK